MSRCKDSDKFEKLKNLKGLLDLSSICINSDYSLRIVFVGNTGISEQNLRNCD